MGCWNGTCGLSQIHITAGEEVFVVPLIQASCSDLCYSSALWEPSSVGFWSHYNDYGAGEDSSGIGLDINLNAIKRSLVEFEQGDNQFHDIPVKVDSFNEEVFWDAIHEGRLQIYKRAFNQDEKAVARVDMVMFKKSILNELKKHLTLETWVESADGGWEEYQYKFDRVEAGVESLVDTMIKQHNDTSDASGPEKKGLRMARFMCSIRGAAITLNMDVNGSSPAYNFAARWLEHRSEGDYGPLSQIDEEVTQDLVELGDRDKLIELVRARLDVRFINHVMHLTRKHWSPQVGAGSQSAHIPGYRALIAAMTTVLDAEEAELSED